MRKSGDFLRDRFFPFSLFRAMMQSQLAQGKNKRKEFFVNELFVSKSVGGLH